MSFSSWLRPRKSAPARRPRRTAKASQRLHVEPLEDRSLLSVDPIVLIGGPPQVVEGQTYTLNLTAVDPDAGDQVTKWTIDWDDGSPVEEISGDPSSATHVYADGPAPYFRNITATAYQGINADQPFAAVASSAGASLDPVGAPFLRDKTNEEFGAIGEPMGQFVFGPDFNDDEVGDIYAIRGNNDVAVYDGVSRAFIQTLITPAMGLSHPRCLILGPPVEGNPYGNLYVNGQNSRNVMTYDFTEPDPQERLKVVIPASFGLNAPQALAFGPDGNLYVTHDAAGLNIIRYDGLSQTLGPDDFFLSNVPYTTDLLNMEFRGNYLYTANPQLGMNRYLYTSPTAPGTPDSTWSIPNTTGQRWYGFTFGPDGDLYISNWAGNTVLQYDPATKTQVGAVTGGSMRDVYEVVFGPDGTGDGRPELYVGAFGSAAIHRFAGPLTEATPASTSLRVSVLNAVPATYSSTPNATIPSDLNTYTWPLEIQDVGPVLDVDVTLNITHSRISELEAYLVSPTGTRVKLFQAVGGAGANFTGTLSDEGNTPVANGSAPFNSPFGYRPQELLSAFDGQQVQGTWILEIRDSKKSNVGKLNSWTLTVTRGYAPSNDPPATLRIGNASLKELDQGTRTAVFEVTLSSPLTSALAVQYATAPGTASAGNDYTHVSGTLTFGAGQMRKLISVTTLGDAVYEPGGEKFYVNLTASGVDPSSDTQGECTIVDDDPNATPTINYASFPNSTGLQLVGHAQITQSRLRLTRELGNRQTGAAWYVDQQPVANGFKSSFRFATSPGGDVGITFVIHNSPTGRGQLGAPEGGVGYDGIENSLVVVFNEVWRTAAVHHNGTGVNKATGEFRHVVAAWPYPLNDGAIHTAVIDYVPGAGSVGGTLRVFVDDAYVPLLTLSIDLDATFNLNNGKMWAGFTAASFNYHTNYHDVISWQFTPLPAGAPLEAAAASPNTGAAPLSQRQAQSLLPEALARWQAAGADIAGLANVSLRIADLGGRTLGLAAGNTIWLDDDAAGWGWFVDPTPRDDSEFLRRGDQGEQGRMDLLTVMMHELGHVLGHEHEDDGVMAESLAAGIRQAPEMNPSAVAPRFDWNAVAAALALDADLRRKR